MCLKDGYKLITAAQLCNGLTAYNDDRITLRAFRAYLACFELLARREAAERSCPARGRRPQRRFLVSELESLVLRDNEEGSLTRELRALRNAQLLSFTETAITINTEPSASTLELSPLFSGRSFDRRIPVPRKMLKHIARSSRATFIKVVIGYMLRGLAIKRGGDITASGSVKIRWLMELCGVSERAAQAARAELIVSGWITKDKASFQRKLNRTGAYFAINLAWGRSGRVINGERREGTSHSPEAERGPVGNSQRAAASFAPLEPEKRTQSAPPLKRLGTSNEPKNPEGARPRRPVAPRLGLPPAKASVGAVRSARSGVCAANPIKRPQKTTLKNILREDLQRVSALKVLYAQAVAAKWLTPSEANERNFIAAAARALRVNGDPVRVFVGIVKRNLWEHLTQEDEDRARAGLRSWIEFSSRRVTQKDAESRTFASISHMVGKLCDSLTKESRSEEFFV